MLAFHCDSASSVVSFFFPFFAGVLLVPPSNIPLSSTLSCSGCIDKQALHVSWNAVKVVASLRCT